MGCEWAQHIHKTVRPMLGGDPLRHDYTSRGQAWPCDPEGAVWGGGTEGKTQTVRLCLRDVILEFSITPISHVQKLRLRESHSDWCWVQIITSPWLPPSHTHTKYKQLRTACVWTVQGTSPSQFGVRFTDCRWPAVWPCPGDPLSECLFPLPGTGSPVKSCLQGCLILREQLLSGARREAASSSASCPPGHL